MDLVSSQKHRRLPSFEICRSFTSDISYFEEKDVAVRCGILQQGKPGCHIRPREKKGLGVTSAEKGSLQKKTPPVFGDV